MAANGERNIHTQIESNRTQRGITKEDRALWQDTKYRTSWG